MEIMDADINLYFSLLNYSLWGTHAKDIVTSLSHSQYCSLTKIAEEQSTLGLISKALIDLNIKLEKDDVLDFLSILRLGNVSSSSAACHRQGFADPPSQRGQAGEGLHKTWGSPGRQVGTTRGRFPIAHRE